MTLTALAPGSTAAIEIFVSYSHRDEELRQRLDKHLSPLRREGFIREWHDRTIDAGTEWAGQIDAHLESAQVILLLVSADFVASDYCWDVEMKRALERDEAGQARVIPIILKPVDWHSAPFARLQVLPTDGKAVTTWRSRDEAFLNVVNGIRRAYTDLINPPARPGPREAAHRDSRLATHGFRRLGEVVEQADIARQEAAKFQIAFRAACDQVDLLGDYKELHDLLHDVQVRCYNPLLPKIRRQALDESEWAEELVQYDQALAGCAARLSRLKADSKLQDADLLPFMRLVPAQQALRAAVEDQDLRRLQGAVLLLKQVLGTQPARINERLVATADDLHFSELATAMERIQAVARDTEVARDQDRVLEAGHDSVGRLHERLMRLVDSHKRWQWIDDQFHLLEEGRQLPELEVIWPDLRRDIEGLCGDPEDAMEQPLVDELRSATAVLSARLSAQEAPPRVWSAFLRLRGVQLQRFYNVDTELKNLCGELRNLDKPLTDFLGRLQ